MSTPFIEHALVHPRHYRLVLIPFGQVPPSLLGRDAQVLAQLFDKLRPQIIESLQRSLLPGALVTLHCLTFLRKLEILVPSLPVTDLLCHGLFPLRTDGAHGHLGQVFMFRVHDRRDTSSSGMLQVLILGRYYEPIISSGIELVLHLVFPEGDFARKGRLYNPRSPSSRIP